MPQSGSGALDVWGLVVWLEEPQEEVWWPVIILENLPASTQKTAEKEPMTQIEKSVAEDPPKKSQEATMKEPTLLNHHGSVNGFENYCRGNTCVYRCPKNTIRQIMENIPCITGLHPVIKKLIIHIGSYDISIKMREVLRADMSYLLQRLNALQRTKYHNGVPVPEGAYEFISSINGRKQMSGKLDHLFKQFLSFFTSANHLFKENQCNLNRARSRLMVSNILCYVNEKGPGLSRQTI